MYHLIRSTLLLLAIAAPASAGIFLDDDFESSPLGVFPAGWSDVGQAPGATGNAPNPSMVVTSTTDAFGSPTRAASLVDAFADSQGLYQMIPNHPIVGISFDVRVDRYASTSIDTVQDWAWDATLSIVGSQDLSVAAAFGGFASAFDTSIGTFVQQYSGGSDTFDVGADMPAGVWHNVNLVLNRTAGTIKITVTEIATATTVISTTRAVPNWLGFASEPAFNAIAILDGELGATTATNLAVYDNVKVADMEIPVTLPSGAVCGNGVPEAGESCDLGAANGLPSSCCTATCQVATASTPCRSAAGICDVSESCDGVNPTCPADLLVGAGMQCRPASGACDIAEVCDGANPDCPPDGFRLAGTGCRAAVGACDVAETCSGGSPVCPADLFVPPGVQCRPAAGPCDVAEACDGGAPTCPVDLFLGAETECRAAADVCDATEACNGSGAACPPDGVLPAGTACRPAASACDQAEVCDGTATSCPADATVAATTGCTVDGVAGQPCQADGSGQTITGTSGDDVIVGGAGDDILKGRQGNDLLCGLGGNDTLVGAGGDDELDGGEGNDILRGEEDEDTLIGGPNDDTLIGGGANDVLDGGDGMDVLRGESGDDDLFGGPGNDFARGGSGMDMILGEGGNDELFGDGADDILDGGDDTDTLNGGAGTDSCDGETETKCEL